MDDSKFEHHYDAKSKESKKTFRERHKLGRIQDFFTAIKALEHLCATGKRHGLVAVLDRNYKDIELVTDTKIYAQSFIQQQIANLLEKHYVAATTAEKNILLEKLLASINGTNEASILSILDPDNELYKEFKTTLARLGISPTEIESVFTTYKVSPIDVDGPCKEVLPSIGLGRSICNVAAIFSMDELENKLSKTPARLTCLNQIKKWINTTGIIISPKLQQHIVNFRELYEVDRELNRRRTLLRVVGKEDDCSSFEKAAKEYFLTFDPSNIRVAANSLLEDARRVKAIINKEAQNKLMDFIENFFVHWFGNAEQRKAVYRVLVDPDTKDIFDLADAEILKWYEANAEENVVWIEVYHINRVILAAIKMRPKEWTPIFEFLFKTVMQYIKNNFDCSPEDIVKEDVVNHLKKASYNKSLLIYMRYLLHRHEGMEFTPRNGEITVPLEDHETEILKIETIIVLPQHATTVEYWQNICVQSLEQSNLNGTALIMPMTSIDIL